MQKWVSWTVNESISHDGICTFYLCHRGGEVEIGPFVVRKDVDAAYDDVKLWLAISVKIPFERSGMVYST